LDPTVGSNGLAQGREFARAAGVTGLVLTKLDGTAKGGIAVAVVRELEVPIRYVGVGETVEDLVPFDAAAFAEGLIGSSCRSQSGERSGTHSRGASGGLRRVRRSTPLLEKVRSGIHSSWLAPSGWPSVASGRPTPTRSWAA